jgi:uncharacterized protein (DUF362 family)
MFIDKKLFRRDFIKKTLTAAAAISATSLFTPLLRLFGKSQTDSSYKTIAVIKGNDLSESTIEKMVKQGFDSLGGIERFIKRGMNVVIKPNIGFNSTPDRAHTTNPVLLEVVARACIKAGARVKIFDRPVNNAKLCYRRSGMIDAAKKAGATIEYVDNRKFREVHIKNPLNLSTLEVYEDILNADFVINMPIAKDHSSATLTMAMKNLMGAIGGFRGRYHLNLHKNIVDFNKAITVDLVILDAMRILTDYGPNAGTLEDIKETRTIIMGTNPVTVDAYTVGFFNMKPQSVGYLKYAAQERMGEINTHRMNIIRKTV